MKATLLIIFLAFIINTGTQITNADDKRAANTLKSFYTAYMSAFSATGSLGSLESVLASLKKKYCTVKCIRQVKQLADETDGDPIIKGQDSDAAWTKTLTVIKDKMPLVYAVSYNYDGYGDDGKPKRNTVTIRLKLIKENGDYKIDHVFR